MGTLTQAGSAVMELYKEDWCATDAAALNNFLFAVTRMYDPI